MSSTDSREFRPLISKTEAFVIHTQFCFQECHYCISKSLVVFLLVKFIIKPDYQSIVWQGNYQKHYDVINWTPAIPNHHTSGRVHFRGHAHRVPGYWIQFVNPSRYNTTPTTPHWRAIYKADYKIVPHFKNLWWMYVQAIKQQIMFGKLYRKLKTD